MHVAMGTASGRYPCLRQSVDDYWLDRRPRLGVGERRVDIVQFVSPDELVDGEPALLPELDQGWNEHLRHRAALNNRLEGPPFQQGGDVDAKACFRSRSRCSN